MLTLFTKDAQDASCYTSKPQRQPRRLTETLHQWHWISCALCLLGMLVFSITGMTLNHATQIEAKVLRWFFENALHA